MLLRWKNPYGYHYREELKSYEFDRQISMIEPNNASPILLPEEIALSVLFDSKNGFEITFEDLNIVSKETDFAKTLKNFNNQFFGKILELASIKEKDEAKLNNWLTIQKLIKNPSKYLEPSE